MLTYVFSIGIMLGLTHLGDLNKVSCVLSSGIIKGKILSCQ